MARLIYMTRLVVAQLNLPLIKLESNFFYAIPQSHALTHTYMDAMAIYALQKLWRIYYYASTYPFSEFSLANNTALNVDPAHLELLLLNCFY